MLIVLFKRLQKNVYTKGRLFLFPYLCTVKSTGDKIDIRSLSLEALYEHFTQMGEKSFRAKQVFEWLWEKSCISFDEMSNISKELRKKLDENFIINNVKINNSQFSADKTIKNSFILYDNNLIEGVLIPAPERMTPPGESMPHP